MAGSDLHEGNLPDGHLTLEQARFLAARIGTATDQDAAKQSGVHPNTVMRWKRDADGREFRERYARLGSDGIELAYAYTRKLLGKAATALDAELDAMAESKRGERVDHAARHRAAELVLNVQGLVKSRQEHTGPGGGPIKTETKSVDYAGLSTEELLQLRQLLARASGAQSDQAGSRE